MQQPPLAEETARHPTHPQKQEEAKISAKTHNSSSPNTLPIPPNLLYHFYSSSSSSSSSLFLSFYVPPTYVCTRWESYKIQLPDGYLPRFSTLTPPPKYQQLGILETPRFPHPTKMYYPVGSIVRGGCVGRPHSSSSSLYFSPSKWYLFLGGVCFVF
jgi:hypothetical protein